MYDHNIKKRFDILPLVLLIVILFQGYLLCWQRTDSIGFFNEPVGHLNSSWTYLDADGTRQTITLPAQLGTPVGETTVLETVVPDGDDQQTTVCLRSSMQAVRAYLDGELIYTYDTEDLSPGQTHAGSAWALFRLPDDRAGKTLRLELSSPYEEFSGKVGSIWFSSKTSILFDIFREYQLGLIAAMALWFTGLILIIIYFCVYFSGIRKSALFYLALFSIAAGCWVFGESKTIQFFTGNEYLIAKLSFLALLSMPLPFTLYLDHAYPRHTIGYPRIFFWLFVINFVVCTALELTGRMDYFQTMLSVQSLLICLVFATIISLLVESFHYHNADARIQLNGIIILGAAALVDLISSWISAYKTASKFFSIGLLIYFIYTGAAMLKRLLILTRDRQEAVFYERLAYTDAVTAGNNRLAFERDAEDAFRRGGDRDNWLVLFDLDHLKVINDTIGHQTGDEAIRLAYQCITQAFADVGKSYRIGGDEYAVIAAGTCEQDVTQCLDRLYAMMAEHQKKLSYEFSISCGKGCFDPENEEFRTFFESVDKHLYENKQQRHKGR